jgi:sensor histidine kinase YesM
MMIQPLVENAIWHGLSNQRAIKTFQIDFTRKKNKIICIVEDNGIGIRRSEKLKERQRPLHGLSDLKTCKKESGLSMKNIIQNVRCKSLTLTRRV